MPPLARRVVAGLDAPLASGRGPTLAAARSAAWFEVLLTTGAARAGSVLPRLRCPPSGWLLRIQPPVSPDLLDHRQFEEDR